MADVLGYNSAAYKSLPDFFEAADRFKAINGESLVKNEIRQLFVDNKMDTTFGLTLLHRHFDLDDDEVLVEYGGTSTAWNMNERLADTSKFHPTLFLPTTDGILEPVEFKYVPQGKDAPSGLTKDEVDFVKKFTALVQEKNVGGLFGLCIYPGDDFQGFIESTKGRTNIQFHPDEFGQAARGNAITTGWYFSPSLWRNGLPEFKQPDSCEQQDNNLCESKCAPGAKLDDPSGTLTGSGEGFSVRGYCIPYTRADGTKKHVYKES